MAHPPRSKSLKREDFPDMPASFDVLLQLLNGFMGDVFAALNHGLTRSQNMSAAVGSLSFATKALAADTFPLIVKTELPFKPVRAAVDFLERVDGAAIANPWSMTWKVGDGNSIQVTFQGLDNSTSYRTRIVYET